jgi:hypothetical protein
VIIPRLKSLRLPRLNVYDLEREWPFCPQKGTKKIENGTKIRLIRDSSKLGYPRVSL